MVARNNLHENPGTLLGRLIERANAQATAAHTRPTGVKDLGETGDVVWTDSAGGEHSLKDLRSEVEDWIAEGIATESGRNTVSTSPPPASHELPEGAWWTQVASADDLTVVGLWQLVDGDWLARSIPDGGLVAPWADIGLMSVAVLGAQLITAKVLRTEVDASGRWARMASDGFTVNGQDGDGNPMELVRLGPSGADLLTVGKATIDGNGNVTAQRVDARDLMVGGQTLAQITARHPRGVIQQVHMPASKIGAWAGTQQTPQMEGFAWLPAGRGGRVESTSVTVECEGGADPWIRLNMMIGSGGAWGTVGEGIRLTDDTPSYVTLPPMSYDLTPEAGDRLIGYSLTLTNRGPGRCRIITGNGGVRIMLSDTGNSTPRGGTVFYNDTGGGGAPPPPPPEPPKRVTKRYNAIAWWGFWHNGNRDSSVSAPTQGQYSAGNRAAFFQFPWWGGDTAGATIIRVTLCSFADHWYSGAGGTASWNVHRSTIASPSSWSQLNPSFVADTSGWPRGAERRIDLPPSLFGQVASGAIRGFGFATPVTALSHYGKFSTDLSRTWVEIEYEK